jgi:hypothetical protein
MKCHTVTCDRPAALVVYWPGENPPPVMCFDCAERAQATAHAMGFAVFAQPLPGATLPLPIGQPEPS